MHKRASGILLHVTSLPSPYGIGDLGPSAYQFVDFLAKAKQCYWQILPINPTDGINGHSPYSCSSVFAGNPLPPLDEQVAGEPARSQFGRALQELGIEWIAAHSPQAKGRIERLFGTLQDRLVKEMRLAGVRTIEQANRFLQEQFVPVWEQRFAVAPRQSRDAPSSQPVSEMRSPMT